MDFIEKNLLWALFFFLVVIWKVKEDRDKTEKVINWISFVSKGGARGLKEAQRDDDFDVLEMVWGWWPARVWPFSSC